MTDARYWIGLSLVPEVGPVMSKKLLSLLGSPENVFSAGERDLLSVKGLGREKVKNIKAFRQWDVVETHLRTIEQKRIKMIRYDEPTYPEILKEVEGAPIVLYMRGEYHPDDRFSIAIVGSRKHTPYGEGVTQQIASDLSSAGFTIISGMARGIDTLAHKSSLASGGRTIAVLGTGIDVAYPSENRGLLEKITGCGCVLSEFPPGTLPSRENFPRRNRLISGLSLGVLVVEATSQSGSLITASCALDQNREVFAVPGNVTSPNSQGTNSLLKQGAKMVCDADDIIRELAPLLKGFIRMREKATVAISPEEGVLCGVLTREAKHIDLLSREAAMPSCKVLDLLLSLELKGVVRQTAGKRFYLS